MVMNKVAFVTGGASGIGKGIALHLAKEGYDVCFSYMSNENNARDVAQQVQKYGRRALPLKADLRKLSDIDAMFVEFKEHFDRLDLFVSNAGVTKKATFLETTEDIFDDICNVDFKGAFFAMQGAARIMREQGCGSIVSISSNNALVHFADVSVYGSVKTAVTKLAEHMAIELAQYNIRVNTIAPGWTDTGAARLDAKEETYYKIPLKKWATVDEVAQTVSYLASDAASSVTGATVVMDNGARLVCDKREKYGF